MSGAGADGELAFRHGFGRDLDAAEARFVYGLVEW